MSVTMGQAFADILTPTQREALAAATDVLIDHYLENLADAQTGTWDFQQFYIADFLPRRYAHEYSPKFARQFFFCLSTIAWKLNQPHFLQPACIGEELALWALIQQAESILEEKGEEPDLGDLVDAAFEDTDVQNLYSGERDGIDETEVGQYMGMTSLSFKDWFVPFRESSVDDLSEVHPCAQVDGDGTP